MGICKRVPAEKGSGKSARGGNLVRYITNPELSNGREKCICSGAENFFSNTQAGQIAEMEALASETVHSKDPIDHWMISLHDDELFSPAQAKEAVDIFLKHTGLEGHQVVWGVHDDTKNRHIHIAVNRMDPVTGKVTKINNGFNKEAGQQIIALIEHRQGWKSETGARYTIVDGKPIMTDKARQTKAERTAGTSTEQKNQRKKPWTWKCRPARSRLKESASRAPRRSSPMPKVGRNCIPSLPRWACSSNAKVPAQLSLSATFR